MNVSTVNLRKFLLVAFSDEELSTFCFDYFQDVYRGFAAGQSKGQRVQALIEYCINHDRLPDLSHALQQARPEQFKEYFEPGNPPDNTSSGGVSAAARRRSPNLGVMLTGIIAVLACTATWLVVPEFRQFLGLDKSTPTTVPVNPTAALISTARRTVMPIATTRPTITPVAIPLNAGAVLTRATDGMVMMWVPAGKFQMGNDNGADAEKPVHEVSLSEFWIDQTEVTNAQYARCVSAGACLAPAGTKSPLRNSYGDSQFANYPVVNISWSDANVYCAWAGSQLPTEAQWEYSARGPNNYLYPWGNDLPDDQRLNFNNPDGDAMPVGAHPTGASWVGALDLSGNVGEWVQDWYGLYPNSPQVDPIGPITSTNKTLRGGSYHDEAIYVQSTHRSPSKLDGHGRNIGFRCALAEPTK